jgi:hypothetical protein
MAKSKQSGCGLTLLIVTAIAVWALIASGLNLPLAILAIVLFWMLIKAFSGPRARNLKEVDAMSGERFEHLVARLLSRQGYHAKVTKLSGDLGVDVVARRGAERIAVQAKRYSEPVSRTAVSDAVGGMKTYNCNSSMVVTNNYFTKGAQQLAKDNECRLVDRDTLATWIEGSPRLSAAQSILLIAFPVTVISLLMTFSSDVRNNSSRRSSEERSGVQSTVSEDQSRQLASGPGVEDFDAEINLEDEPVPDPEVEARFDIPHLDDGTPDWKAYTKTLYDHYYNAYRPPAIGSWVVLSFSNGSTREGHLVELSDRVVSISVPIGSVGFDRVNLSEDCKISLFARDHAMHHTRRRLESETEKQKDVKK